MTHLVDGLQSESALGRINTHARCVQSCEDRAEVLEIFFLRPTIDDNVVEINLANIIQQSPKGICHLSLKIAGG